MFKLMDKKIITILRSKILLLDVKAVNTSYFQLQVFMRMMTSRKVSYYNCLEEPGKISPMLAEENLGMLKLHSL